MKAALVTLAGERSLRPQVRPTPPVLRDLFDHVGYPGRTSLREVVKPIVPITSGRQHRKGLTHRFPSWRWLPGCNGGPPAREHNQAAPALRHTVVGCVEYFSPRDITTSLQLLQEFLQALVTLQARHVLKHDCSRP